MPIKANKAMALISIIIAIAILNITATVSESQATELMYLSIEKPSYQTGESVMLIITAESLQGYDLSITSQNNLYRYSGELINNIEFYPKEEGMHIVQLVDKATNSVADSLEFIVGSTPAATAAASSSGSIISNAESTGNDAESQESNILDSNGAGQANDFVYTDKPVYKIGEVVTVYFKLPETATDSFNLYYEYSGMSQRYIGEFTEIRFVPRGLGKHCLILRNKNDNNIITNYSFEVIEKPATPFEIKDSSGVPIEAAINFYSQDGKLLMETTTLSSFSLPEGIYSAEIMPESKIINKIIFYGLQGTSLDLGLEQVYPLKNPIQGELPVKSFAIDPTGISFDSAIVSQTAIGDSLWKCKEYDFSNQNCYGTWEYLMPITPGQEYNFTLTPEDPLYSETLTNVSCSCQNSVTASGPPANVSCNVTCAVVISVPPSALTGYLTNMSFWVNITINGSDTADDATHIGILDRDQTYGNGNESTIGSSASTTTTTEMWTNNSLNPTGQASFSDVTCDYWANTCTWYIYLSTRAQFDPPGSASKSLTVNISLINISYAWNYTQLGNLYVLLNWPSSNHINYYNNIMFNYTPVSTGTLTNCTLYTNRTGAFTNESITYSPDNNQSNYFYLNFSSDGSYKWNVLCYDDAGNNAWSIYNNTFTIDTGTPNVTLERPENNNYTTNGVVTFYYNVSDNSTISNCSLIIDSSIDQTDYTITKDASQSFMTALSNGLHNWSVVCYDAAGNPGYSENRTINVSTTRRIWTTRWYETGTSDYYNETATISLDNQTDGTANSAYYRLTSGTGATLVEATSPYIGGDGAYIPINTNITFRSAFSSSNTNIEASWHLYILHNNGSTTEVCYYGNDAAEGEPVTAITQNSCLATTEHWLSGTDRLLLEINIYNTHPAQAYEVNHTIDSINSYVNFENFITLGRLVVEMISPTTDLTLSQGETFNQTCNVTCIEGTCVNTNVYAQYNTSTDSWTSISSTGNIILNGTETNPHSQGNLSSMSNTTYFWFIANLASVNNIRCIATSMFSNATGTTIQQIIISDSEAPQVNLTKPADYNYSSSSTVIFYFNVSEASTLANCSLILNGSIYTVKNTTDLTNNAENNFTVSGLIESTYTWNVNCTDTSGYTGNGTERTIYIDLTDPWISLNSPAPGETIGFETVNFNWTAYDNYASINLSCDLYINGTLNQSNINSTQGVPANFTVTGFKVGLYTWYMNCSDASGRRNISETRNFSIQDNSPMVYLMFPPNEHHNNSEPMLFLYNASDNNGFKNCTIYIDGEENQTNQYPVINNEINNFTVSGLAEGLHNWTVMCIDTGDLNYTAEWQNFTIDRTAPNVTLLAPERNATITNGDVSFTYNATDNLATALACELFVDGVSRDNSTASHGIPETIIINNLIDGFHYWNVTCLDNATNPGYSELRNITVNETPSIALGTPEPGNYTTENLTFTYTPSDNDGFVNCTIYIDGTPNSTNYTITSSALNEFIVYKIPEGNHTWYVECFDNGTYNNRNISEERNFTVDITPPALTLNYPGPDDVVNSSQVNFNFTADDNYDLNITCDLYVNGLYNQSAGAEAGNQTIVPVNFTNGRYNWSVTCYDDVGNYNASETRWFNVSVPPSVQLTFPEPDMHMNFSDQMFEYIPHGNSDLVNCTLFLDGQQNDTNSTIDPDNYNYFWVYYDIEGLHNWSVSCTDIDGLTGWSETRYFYLDFHAPRIELTNPPDNTTITRNRVTFNFTAYDSISENLTCNVTVSGAPYGLNLNVTNSTPYNFSYTLPDGNYSWYVECRDMASNYNMSDEWNFSIVAPPNVTLLSPPNNHFTNTTSINLTYLPEDDYVIPNCTLYINGTYYNETTEINTNGNNTFVVNNIGQGLYNWTVYCTDQDGNSFAPSEWNFTIDQEAPAISLANPEPNATLLSADVMFNFTATDNLDNNISCEMTLNGSVNKTGISLANGTYYNFTNYRMNDGLFIWNITCWDHAYNTNTSETRNFSVQEPPSVYLGDPADNNRTSNTNISFFFTPDDNSGNITSCTLILNGEANETLNTVNISVENNITLYNMANGTYAWTVNCTDASGNVGTNTSTKTLYIDLTGPTIILYEPGQDETFNEDDIYFNWTAIDFENTTIVCNLTVSDPLGQLNASITAISGSYFNTTLYNLSDGIHFWNVTCWDDLGNNATSDTWNFTINQPDLLINSGNISFSNTNPDENQTITINATIYNIGGRDASNVIVDFWDGLPETGTYLGNDTINVNGNASAIAQLDWNITLGYHTIWIVIDPDNLITELEENNNNASKNISILRAYFNSPPNMTITNDTTPQINFTMQDFTGGTIDYTIYVDGVPNGQSGSSTDNTSVAIDLNALAEGRHTIIVMATDALSRQKNSTGLVIIIDSQAPVVHFETQNNTWYNHSSPEVFFNITDSIDDNINYSIFINSAFQNSSNATNGTSVSQVLGGLSDGRYNITVQATDDANQSANYSIIIYVDTTKPSINLTYPEESANFTTSSLVLNFTATDNLASSLTCNLTLDGIINRSNFEVQNASQSSTNISGLGEGTHYWNVTCWDNANNTNTSETRSFNIYNAPLVVLVAPANNNLSNNQTQVFYFNVSDETGIENCTLILDGLEYTTKNNSDITNNATNSFTIGGLNGTYSWAVKCFDNTSFHASNTTSAWNITIDPDPPEPVITTANQSWFNTSAPLIDFIITDHIDDPINYTFYVNGAPNATGAASNGTPSSDSLESLIPDGTYTIFMKATDDAGNTANSTSIVIFVDTAKPDINLSAPAPGEFFNITDVQFNFTATDSMASYLMCNLTISNGMYEHNINATNNTLQNITKSGFTAGNYYWNVSCIDLAGNRNTSETRNFTIRSPDLLINSGNISFNETNPEEGNNITVYANVYNLGGIPASNITVQFWKGDPDSGGMQVNGNLTISLLSGGENFTVNVTYTANISDNNIFVVVDPPTATNGTIVEDNESNNKANNSFSVSLYHVYAGNASELIDLEKQSLNLSMYQWNVSNATGSNIFVTDLEAAPDFNSLQAISRDTSNNSASNNDFEDVDAALGSTNYTDSINITYTTGGAPKATRAFNVFSHAINNVPIVNSTNTSSFVTGIMWDQSDGGTEYSGTQDLVFITEINKQQQGSMGVYDFEIKVPALLRNYNAAGNTVAFYYELK